MQSWISRQQSTASKPTAPRAQRYRYTRKEKHGLQVDIAAWSFVEMRPTYRTVSLFRFNNFVADQSTFCVTCARRFTYYVRTMVLVRVSHKQPRTKLYYWELKFSLGLLANKIGTNVGVPKDSSVSSFRTRQWHHQCTCTGTTCSRDFVRM